MAPSRKPSASVSANVVWGRFFRDLSIATATLSRTSLTASTASRPLSWASETTLRTFARAAMARSFRTQLCAVKPNVDTKVPRSAFRARYAAVVPPEGTTPRWLQCNADELCPAPKTRERAITSVNRVLAWKCDSADRREGAIVVGRAGAAFVVTAEGRVCADHE